MKKMSIQTGSLNFNVTGTGNPTAILNDNTVVEIETDKLSIDNEQQFKIHNDTISFLQSALRLMVKFHLALLFLSLIISIK